MSEGNAATGRTRVGDLGEFINGFAFKPTDWGDSGLPIIRIQNLTDPDKPLNRTMRLVPAKYRVEPGDLLVSWSATLDAFIWDKEPALLNQHIFKVVLRPDIADKRYAFYSLRYAIEQMRKTEHLHGSTMKHINRGPFLSYAMDIPSLGHQRKVAGYLDELFSHLDAAVKSLERAKANLKRYRASVLKAAVEGRLTEDWRKEHSQAEDGQMLLDRILRERREKWELEQFAKFREKGKEPPKNWQSKYKEPAGPDASELPELPEGWVWATVEQVNCPLRPISYGVLQPGGDLDGGIPLIRVCDVVGGRVLDAQLKRISPNISAQYQRTILRGGEVLLTVVGTIGRTAVVPQSLAGANTARAVAVIAVLLPVSPQFFELCLREDSMRVRLTKASHEVARKTLNLEDVRITTIPLPPLAEQQQIVALVEERLSQIDAAEQTIDAELLRAKRLRQSILKQAFEGKLVPQDPNDEPASVLLERIKASREQEQPKRAKKAKRVKAR